MVVVGGAPPPAVSAAPSQGGGGGAGAPSGAGGGQQQQSMSDAIDKARKATELQARIQSKLANIGLAPSAPIHIPVHAG